VGWSKSDSPYLHVKNWLWEKNVEENINCLKLCKDHMQFITEEKIHSWAERENVNQGGEKQNKIWRELFFHC